MIRATVVCILGCAIALSACGERVQTIAVGTGKKTDTPGWVATDSVYLAPGWVPGDKAVWEAQLRARAQSQNDFAVAK